MLPKFIRKTFVKPYRKWVKESRFKKTGYITPEYAAASLEPAHPAGVVPDHITLTPAADPARGQIFNWRTNAQVKDGFVEICAADVHEASMRREQASYAALTLPEFARDAENRYFYADVQGLTPNTRYRYRVGSVQQAAWSPNLEFTTGPAVETQPFTFAYLGDFQTGFVSIGKMLRDIVTLYPQTAFFAHAGDFVNNGEKRNEWDEFFAHTGNVFAQRFLAPTPGNHDYHDIDAVGPLIYVKNFNLPANGAPGLPPNHSYSFTYGNASFIVADTNLSLKLQTPWLKQRLAEASARKHWIIVLFHHPVFSSKKHRGKKALFKNWTPLFDEYGVDLVLSGHDHGYMRSHRLRYGKIGTGAGTTYVLATGGEQFYKMECGDFAAVKRPQTQTYQLIEVNAERDGRPALVYKAFDIHHQLVDEFAISK